MKKLKNNFKFIIGIIIGGIVFGTISIAATNKLSSSVVSFNNDKTSTSKNTLQDAIDDLYAKAQKVSLCPDGYKCEKNTSGGTSVFSKDSIAGIMKKLSKGTISNFNLNSNDSSGKTNGVYETTDFDIVDDSINKIYYYRGLVDNNLIFGNFCWKIIRTTETGGIKLLYNGVPVNGQCDVSGSKRAIKETTYAYNKNSNDNAYVGYMYGQTSASDYESTHANVNDSFAKSTIDDWYENNLKKYENQIEDTVFCNDRSTEAYDSTKIGSTYYSSYTTLGYYTKYTLYSSMSNTSYYSKTLNPTYKCKQENDRFSVSSDIGNGALDYPVAMITADELIFGGFNTYYSNSSSYSNGNTYLYGELSYWTMTPVYYSGTAAMDYCYNNIQSEGVIYSKYIRPVISLKPGTVPIEGNGTISNPYVVVS